MNTRKRIYRPTSFMLPEDQREALKWWADQLGETQSALVRMAIFEYLTKRGEEYDASSRDEPGAQISKEFSLRAAARRNLSPRGNNPRSVK